MKGRKLCFPAFLRENISRFMFSDMDGWYKSHLAFILPICFVCYALDCDLTKIRGKQLDLMMDAAGEGYAMLAALGCPVLPGGVKKPLRRDGRNCGEHCNNGKWSLVKMI